jgi:hypothetical protein
MSRSFSLLLFLIVLMLAGCPTTPNVQQKLAEAEQKAKCFNPNTRATYSSPEESEQATRDYFRAELAKVQADPQTLDVRALIVLPSANLIRERYGVGARFSNIYNHIEMSYRFLGDSIRKRNIFRVAEVKTVDSLENVDGAGFDLVLFPRWDATAPPWEAEKWFLKKPGEWPVQVEQPLAQGDWLHTVKKAAQEKMGAEPLKEPRAATLAPRQAPPSREDLFQSLQKSAPEKVEAKSSTAIGPGGSKSPEAVKTFTGTIVQTQYRFLVGGDPEVLINLKEHPGITFIISAPEAALHGLVEYQKNPFKIIFLPQAKGWQIEIICDTSYKVISYKKL